MRNRSILCCSTLLLSMNTNAVAQVGNPTVPPVDAQLEEVTVTATRKESLSEATTQTEKLLKLPASFGDPMQTIFALPGIVQTSEGRPNPAVRGSGPADNVFLVDALPAGAIFHPVMGNSIFAEDLLRDFGLKAAGFGAAYGGATGAVFDISLREPRRQELRTSVEASFLRAGVLLEGAATRDQRFYFSYRESLIHLILPITQKEQNKEDDIDVTGWPRARDMQAKYVWDLNAEHQVSFTSLGAQDAVSARFGGNSDLGLVDPGSVGDALFKTRFISSGLRWDYRHGDTHSFVTLGQLHTNGHAERGNGNEYSDIDLRELNLKAQYQQSLGSRNDLLAGLEQQRQRLGYTVHARYRSCTGYSPECATDPGVLTDASDARIVNISSVWLQDRLQLTSSWSMTPGVRYSHNDYLTENHLEPRFNTEWQLSPRWSVHADWGQYHQAPEIVQMLPVFGNPQLDSPTATHYVFGVKQQLSRTWSWNSDLYYKDLRKLVVDVDDANRFQNLATGHAYGAELMINKELVKRWSGWFTLSLARTTRELNNVSSRFDYDTPVVANLVLNYNIGRRWESGMRWNFRSGFPYTAIVGNQPNPAYPGYYLPVYGALNGSRASPYHRLDLHFGRPFGRSSGFNGSWFIDIVNVYNRKNGGSVVYKPVAGSADYTLEKQDSLPLIPSVGVKLNF